MFFKRVINNKTFLNFLISLVSQIVVLVLGLVVPRIILTSYGSDVNGLTSTITQIFTYVALLEAGIGVAAKNALYRPIQQCNEDEICIIINSAKTHFRRITVFYALIVIGLSFCLPIILKSTVDYWTIFLLILFEGFTNVISFYFINVWICYLNSSGKSYVINIFDLICKLLCYSIKIILALNGFNIAYIQIGFFIVSLIKLLLYYVYMKKKYSWIFDNTKREIVKLPNRNDYIITEIAWTIFSSTDMIVLSIFVSTSLASVYSVYNMVFLSLNSLLSSIYTALNYKLGLAYHTGIEKYKIVHDNFNSFFVGVIVALISTAYLIIIPFVKLYTSGVEDINYVYEWLPLLFCLVQLLSWSRYVSGNLTGISGHAKLTSRISIIEAVINLVLSVILVNFFDIMGVLIATVIALPLKVLFCNIFSDRVVLKRSCWNTIKILGANYLLFLLVVIFGYYVKFNINNYLEFLIYGAIIFFALLLISFLMNVLINRKFITFFRN